MRADPLAHGEQALDKAERRGRIPCVGDGARGMHIAQRAVTHGNRDDPAQPLPVVLPVLFAFLAGVVLRRVVAPVDARQRKPSVQPCRRSVLRLHRLVALRQQVVSRHQGKAGQQACTGLAEFGQAVLLTASEAYDKRFMAPAQRLCGR